MFKIIISILYAIMCLRQKQSIIYYHRTIFTIAINIENQRMLDCTTEITTHAHLILCEYYLEKRIKLSNLYQVDWELQTAAVHVIPNICICGSAKIFSNSQGMFVNSIVKSHVFLLCADAAYVNQNLITFMFWNVSINYL